jgi:hypothetical protein
MVAPQVEAYEVMRLAFGVWRLAFGVWSSAFGVQRLEFSVWRLAFGVQRLGFGVPKSKKFSIFVTFRGCSESGIRESWTRKTMKSNPEVSGWFFGILRFELDDGGREFRLTFRLPTSNF